MLTALRFFFKIKKKKKSQHGSRYEGKNLTHTQEEEISM